MIATYWVQVLVAVVVVVTGDDRYNTGGDYSGVHVEGVIKIILSYIYWGPSEGWLGQITYFSFPLILPHTQFERILFLLSSNYFSG